MAIEKSNDNLPQSVSKDGLINFFIALDNNLEVDGYAVPIGAGNILKSGSIRNGIKWQGIQFGDESDSANYDNDKQSPWIIAQDGMAFQVTIEYSSTCEKKSVLNATSSTFSDYTSKSCLGVAIDINGLGKGPNESDPQRNSLSSTTKLKKLAGDRYVLYLAKDGLAKGSPYNTITGRLLAGENRLKSYRLLGFT